QTCPHWAVPGPPDGSSAVRAADIGAAIRCSRAGDVPRETETAEPLTSHSGRGRPHPVASDTGMARVGFRPRSLRLSPSTSELLFKINKDKLYFRVNTLGGMGDISLAQCDIVIRIGMRR